MEPNSGNKHTFMGNSNFASPTFRIAEDKTFLKSFMSNSQIVQGPITVCEIDSLNLPMCEFIQLFKNKSGMQDREPFKLPKFTYMRKTFLL